MLLHMFVYVIAHVHLFSYKNPMNHWTDVNKILKVIIVFASNAD